LGEEKYFVQGIARMDNLGLLDILGRRGKAAVSNTACPETGLTVSLVKIMELTFNSAFFI
jgi:hypothetical protein